MVSSSRILVKVGQYYFFEHLTMAEIGKKLGFSRHKVGRLIKEAVDTKVVKIEIQAPLAKNAELERQLELALDLKTSVIVDIGDEPDAEVIKQLVSAAGAGFVADCIEEGDTIGIGWGSTTFGLVDNFAPQKIADVKVVQITGGNKHLSAHFDCQDVTRRLAEKLYVEPVLLHAPAIVDSKEVREIFIKEASIASTFAYYDKFDLTIVGIGSLVPERSSTLLASGYIHESLIKATVDAGAVGDVYSYFIDEQGNLVDSELHDRIIAISTDQLQRVKSSVGIASGIAKAKAVTAAALGGFVNILIIDSSLAKAILNEYSGTQ